MIPRMGYAKQLHEPVPVESFQPDPERSYLVFCPDHGAWRVGIWWTVDGSRRWVLAMDVMIDIAVSHVMELPADPMDASVAAEWLKMRHIEVAGNA